MAPRDALRGGAVEVFQLIGRATDDYDVNYFDINSLYPAICIKNSFPVGPGVHLKGPKMTSRLSLNYEKGCFVYHDPEHETYKEVDGVLKVVVGIQPHLHQLSSFPFLPIRYPKKGKDHLKTFRASCKKCLLDRKKGLCTHGMDQRRWCETYNCREVAYAVTKLGYTLYAIHEGLIYTNLQPIFEEFMRLMASNHATKRTGRPLAASLVWPASLAACAVAIHRLRAALGGLFVRPPALASLSRG